MSVLPLSANVSDHGTARAVKDLREHIAPPIASPDEWENPGLQVRVVSARRGVTEHHVASVGVLQDLAEHLPVGLRRRPATLKCVDALKATRQELLR